jgi:hypothetical protein
LRAIYVDHQISLINISLIMFYNSLLTSFIFTIVNPNPLIPRESKGIQWGPCDPILAESLPTVIPLGWSGFTYDCVNFSVPLDYTDPNSSSLTLENSCSSTTEQREHSVQFWRSWRKWSSNFNQQHGTIGHNNWFQL